MAGENTLGTLQGLYKKVYAENVKNLIPDNIKFSKEIQFAKKNKRVGESYNQPVVLKSEHGRV